ncbi:MAG: molybdate ABC transporter substrate-binding protein [Actinomycetia bacterium]|nr:molybdate ABC transporter substrate-binding protein [Actinomycetes bacterium]
MTARVRAAVGLVVAMAAAATATCASDSEPVAGDQRRQELLVSVAASLTDAFAEITEDFEAANPGVAVVLNLDSSATLASQISSGAPVDVFASADEPNMAEVVDSGDVVGEPVEFARNGLVIVTAPGNPLGIEDQDDLAQVTESGEVVALCVATAPCGTLADRALGQGEAVLSEDRVTRAANARATLAAVTRGDAAAALVYASDALAAGDAVEIVRLKGRQGSNRYLVAALANGEADGDLASAFVGFVASEDGRRVLDRWGFE